MVRRRLPRTAAPRFPEHPESEHRWRIDRVRRMLKADNLDALVLSRNVNVFYATGSRFVFVGMDGSTGVHPQSTAIITPDADVYCQRFGSFDTDDVPLHTTWSESLELYTDELDLVGVLKDYGIGRGARIGMEWGPGLCTGINPIKFEVLTQRLADDLGAEVVDSSSTIWKVTAVKSRLEIERMRVAVAAAAQAMEHAYDIVELGMTEVDLSRAIGQHMLASGADAVSHAQVMGRSDDGLQFKSCNALDRPIQRGWVDLDIGAKYRRYGSDINRSILVGREPRADEVKLYDCRAGACGVLDRVIKPGASIDDALVALQDYVAEQGCVLQENRGVIFGGHAIGLENYQRPNLAPAASQPEFQNSEGKVLFEPGMMFTYEMPIRLPGSEAFFNVEDNVVVTETGVENMSAMLSREMQVKR